MRKLIERLHIMDKDDHLIWWNPLTYIYVYTIWLYAFGYFLVFGKFPDL